MLKINRNIRSLLLSCALLAAVPINTYGQINSPGARTLFARNFLYRSDWRVTRSTSPLSESNKTNGLTQDRSVLAWENTFVYGLPYHLAAVGVVPFVTRSTSHTLDGQRNSSRDTGFADPTFLLQYDGLYRSNRPGGFTRLAGFFGVRAPLGTQGFSTDATAFIPGLIFTHATERWWFSSDIEWVANTEANGVAVGDVLRADASLMYRLLTYPQRNDLFLVFEVNSFSEAKARRGELEIEDSGGKTVFISPGIEFFLWRNLVLEFSVQIPVRQSRNGTQLDRDWVLVSGFRFLY